jgi:excinuclease ABC subunit A
MSELETIRLRGVRQNNLQGFDLDLPLGKLIVVTGLSGAGKSSLVFETLHAEGQRRYVETFSPYMRQFLERLDRPRVERIENIRPSIAIEQTNTVKTSRSTVGTMTELCDYFKAWWPHTARLHDPATGEIIEDDNPRTIWRKARERWDGRVALVSFAVQKPAQLAWAEVFGPLRAQGYARAAVQDENGAARVARLEDLEKEASRLAKDTLLLVVQDRMALTVENSARFFEAARAALRFGQGSLRLLDEEGRELGRFSEGLHSPQTGRKFRPATPGLFSFNSPLGACPKCRGFGRVIEIDERLVIPDATLTLAGGAIRPFQGAVYGESQRDMARACKKHGVPMDVPWREMSEKQRELVLAGEPGYGDSGKEWPRAWYGVRRFFTWLEGNAYKMHVRVFLSRYRTYTPCPDCHGARLQPEALLWKWRGRTLPELYRMPVDELLTLLAEPAGRIHKTDTKDARAQSDLALDGIRSRLRYLTEVGLGYLTLDRPTRTLSGGETERVNLTTCLGSSLVETLFVLDEPSVGLHPRDIHRLIGILRRLADQGNTVVVVEHDEAVMRAADHVVEIGPEPGKRGGRLVFNGSLQELLKDRGSLTGQYLTGRKILAPPEKRRTVKTGKGGTPFLTMRGVTLHNLHGLDVALPLGRLVGLCGVSGSGKSTLLEHALYEGLRAHRGQAAEEPAQIGKINVGAALTDLVLVDQSPVSRTPRSNAALYCGAWDAIRKLLAESEGAKAAGFTASHFSFNSGDGRCAHCAGLGYERVEMQFMSDLFVPCPSCAGKRFRPEVLACDWRGHSVAEILGLEVREARELFAEQKPIAMRLKALEEVGLGYLPMGQPLTTLSGGESQRLKLVRYLGGMEETVGAALLLLDEPTTGLHRHDVGRLLEVLQRLVERGHSVAVVEHQPDVLAACDWLIELGPEAGARGGKIVAEGTPEQLARGKTATAPFLKRVLEENTAIRVSGLGVRVEEKTKKNVKKNAELNEAGAGALRVVGAREHNLKNLTFTLPRREFTVVTGVSGSGKSSLAFDIVFAEGQRRFLESMSSYARQFVEQLPRPDVDAVSGLPPTVAIEQRVTRGGRKSTVATVTEVAPYLRLLYARLGVPHSLVTDAPLVALGRAELERSFRAALKKRTGAGHRYLFAPLARGRKGHHQPLADWARAHGYKLLRCDGRLTPVEKFTKLDRYREHDVEVAVADFGKQAEERVDNAAVGRLLDTALKLGSGACFLLDPKGGKPEWFSTTRTDPATGESFPEPEPKHFSWNSPRGWCPRCRGHGRLFAELEGQEDIYAEAPSYAESTEVCPECNGARLNAVSQAVKLHFADGTARSLPQLLALPPTELLRQLKRLKLDARGRLIAAEVVPQMAERLSFLGRVGLSYLTLDRSADTLSGGEAQRIRLAAQLGSNLAGVLYVLDEPSIGLHARDNRRLLESLRALQRAGNSLLVVEHDEDTLRQADRILDLGPGAGVHGGHLVAQGRVADILKNPASLTGKFLREGIAHPRRGQWREVGTPKEDGKEKAGGAGFIVARGVTLRNLKGGDAWFPRGRLVVVCGPSGAGKSTLVRDLLEPAAMYAAKHGLARVDGKTLAAKRVVPADAAGVPTLRELTGAQVFRQVMEVNQDPIGQTPRSTPATYIGAFEHIRAIFAQLPEARMRGHSAGWFSFNTKGGRCETCAGAGRVKLEMSFLPEAWLPCEDCGGDRYGVELREMRWNGKSLAEVLRMSFEEAAQFFSAHRKLKGLLDLMVETGLGYLTLGQTSPTLSGGEAQRLKLVSELTRGLPGWKEMKEAPVGANESGAGRAAGQHLYILEEPTIGLHQSDVVRLIDLLHRLVDRGHTVVVIEHHLDLIAEADWVIEVGPDGGAAGGRLMYQGPVAGLAKRRDCPTGVFLRGKLKGFLVK